MNTPPEERSRSPLAIDLTRMHRRTVTSFYSNLVTRPTGRAIRMGVESQLAELEGETGPCLSVLDFTQVRVLDYSCADEIVAKLLLRYFGPDRPAEAYFVGRGLQEHHREAIEAVLERHDLRMVVHEEGAVPELLGPVNPLERACWGALAPLGTASLEQVAAAAGLAPDVVAPALERLVGQRVVLSLSGGRFRPLCFLGEGT